MQFYFTLYTDKKYAIIKQQEPSSAFILPQPQISEQAPFPAEEIRPQKVNPSHSQLTAPAAGINLQSERALKSTQQWTD
jgi:hypothetical protein